MEPIIQERRYTNFEDVATPASDERGSDEASVAWKGWAGARVKSVPCPLHRAHMRCLLRVTPRRAKLSLKESERELKRMKEELRTSNALGKLGVAPELEQGEVDGRWHRLAMVIEEYDLDLGRFIIQPKTVSDEEWRHISKLVINLLFKIARVGIFHGDIKPENIVLKRDRASGAMEAKLIDFDPKYMSTIAKDHRLLEDELEGNISQLCALYAVSMMAILHYHFKDGHTQQPVMLKRMNGALKLFTLFLPRGMDLAESKFGKVLVRHIRHYKLMVPEHPEPPPAGERERLLSIFWQQLREMGVEVQEEASDTPTFEGKANFFADNRSKLSMREPVPPLSKDLKQEVEKLTAHAERKHRDELEKRRAAKAAAALQ